jgi:hypothetical protein
MFNELRASEHMMKSIAKKNRRAVFFGKWGFIIGVGGTILALLF